jgi:hypothetical protein
MVFTGRDASGAAWTQQIAVPFLPQSAGSNGSAPNVSKAHVRR